MNILADFLRWMRAEQTQVCVDFCDARVQRAKVDLYNAMAARDAAMADVRINEPAQSVPAFLLKGVAK